MNSPRVPYFAKSLLAALLLGGPAQALAQAGSRDSALALDSLARIAFERPPQDLQRARDLSILAARGFASLADDRNQATSLNRVGAVFLTLGRNDSALVYFRQALALRLTAGDRLGQGRSLNNIALVFPDRPDSALLYLGSALEVFRTEGDQASQATVLSRLGETFDGVGRSDSAFSYLRAALLLERAAGLRSAEVRTLNALGIAFGRVGQTDSALGYFRSLLTVARSTVNPALEAAALNNLGRLFERLGKLDSAVSSYRAALALPDRGVGPQLRASILTSLGVAYYGSGKLDSALVFAREGLQIRRGIADSTGIGVSLTSLGVIFYGLGLPDSALAKYREALPIHRATGDRRSEATALSNLAGLYYGEPAIRDPVRAAAYFDSAAAVYRAVRSGAGEDANRIAFAERKRTDFQDWPLALLALGGKGWGPRATRASLAALERGRSQALLDLMRGGIAPQERLPLPGSDLAAEGDSLLAPLRRTRAAMITYLLARDTLITWALLPSGNLRLFRAAITPDSLSALVASLRSGLGADSARAAMARGGPPADSDQESTRAATAASSWVPSDLANTLLGSVLLPGEVISALPPGAEVVIVPHGVIGVVPFAALRTAPSSEPFGIRYAIRYAPSLTVLREAENRSIGPESPERMEGAGLVVGNPAMPWVQSETGAILQLNPLPGAEREGREIASLLGAQLLAGTDASETEIRRRLSSASVVHLATHGLAFGTDARVRSSYVALAPDSLNDGLLTVGEIVDDPQLVLRASLVVLSACQTGLGNMKQTEGTIGLQRAFLGKGARGVLVSLWSVDDRATEMLMHAFYRQWLRTGPPLSKAEALRRAQEEVRKTPGFSHPRFWAGFQLVGAR